MSKVKKGEMLAQIPDKKPQRAQAPGQNQPEQGAGTSTQPAPNIKSQQIKQSQQLLKNQYNQQLLKSKNQKQMLFNQLNLFQPSTNALQAKAANAAPEQNQPQTLAHPAETQQLQPEPVQRPEEQAPSEAGNTRAKTQTQFLVPTSGQAQALLSQGSTSPYEANVEAGQGSNRYSAKDADTFTSGAMEVPCLKAAAAVGEQVSKVMNEELQQKQKFIQSKLGINVNQIKPEQAQAMKKYGVKNLPIKESAKSHPNSRTRKEKREHPSVDKRAESTAKEGAEPLSPSEQLSREGGKGCLASQQLPQELQARLAARHHAPEQEQQHQMSIETQSESPSQQTKHTGCQDQVLGQILPEGTQPLPLAVQQSMMCQEVLELEGSPSHSPTQALRPAQEDRPQFLEVGGTGQVLRQQQSLPLQAKKQSDEQPLALTSRSSAENRVDSASIKEKNSIEIENNLEEQDFVTQDKLSNPHSGLQAPSKALGSQNEINSYTELVTKKPTFQYYNTNMEMYMLYPNNYDYFNHAYREHFQQSFHALGFCKMLPPFSEAVLAEKRVRLGEKNPNHIKSIVFDLDETLIHCNEEGDSRCDKILPILFQTGELIQAGINIRPFAIEVLKDLSKQFEIIVFTASHSCYAAKVLEYLDPDN